MTPVSNAMVMATGLGPKLWESFGITKPAKRIPTGAIAVLMPMIEGSVPQLSMLSESRGNISPSEKENTQTAAQAATKLRQLTVSSVSFKRGLWFQTLEKCITKRRGPAIEICNLPESYTRRHGYRHVSDAYTA